MRRAVVSVVLVLAARAALAVCPKPTPKACNEFFKSDTVVVGTVVSRRAVPEVPGVFDDGWIYRVRVRRRFRGPKRHVVEVFAENNNGHVLVTKRRAAW